MTSPHVRWTRGGEASVAAFDGDRISVQSTTPSAPGSRPEGTLPSGAPLRLKVARCRRQEDGFLIEGRVLDATRETRAEVQALAPPLAP
jgi:hypothetical protein